MKVSLRKFLIIPLITAAIVTVSGCSIYPVDDNKTANNEQVVPATFYFPDDTTVNCLVQANDSFGINCDWKNAGPSLNKKGDDPFKDYKRTFVTTSIEKLNERDVRCIAWSGKHNGLICEP
jgi:hypothetical protein